eukprot:sb/3474491/
MLDHLVRTLKGRAVYGVFPARSRGDDVIVTGDDGVERTCYMLRQQVKSGKDEVYVGTADFISPAGDDHMGMFTCSVFGSVTMATEYERRLLHMLPDYHFRERLSDLCSMYLLGYKITSSHADNGGVTSLPKFPLPW